MIPSYDKWIEPIFYCLAANPDGIAARDVQSAIADQLGVTDEERQQLLPSGLQPIYKNRAGWAHDRLKRAGLSHSPRRGYWQLTSKGREWAAKHSQALPPDVLESILEDFIDVRLKADSRPAAAESASTATPDDRLGEAIRDLRSTVAREVLDCLSRISPSYFETVVLHLLHAMGYGASRDDVQRVGRSGDGGIDGVISLDRLGLEKVYVQAKRWKDVVGRPQLHEFHGALAGQRAKKGVFLTTSSFSAQALEFARSVDIVLIDGSRLAELMIDYEVGVSSRTLKVPKLDSDYFDEEFV